MFQADEERSPKEEEIMVQVLRSEARGKDRPLLGAGTHDPTGEKVEHS